MAAASENSVITLKRRVKLCKASSGAITALPPITKIAFGSGGVDGNGDPIAPTQTQEALNQPLREYAVGSVTYPEDTTARYTVTIPADDLTGASISEAALVDSEGDLAAIKTMYAKRKDAGVAFTFEFDDEF